MHKRVVGGSVIQDLPPGLPPLCHMSCLLYVPPLHAGSRKGKRSATEDAPFLQRTGETTPNLTICKWTHTHIQVCCSCLSEHAHAHSRTHTHTHTHMHTHMHTHTHTLHARTHMHTKHMYTHTCPCTVLSPILPALQTPQDHSPMCTFPQQPFPPLM